MLTISSSLIILLLTAIISLFLGWHARNFLSRPTAKELKLNAELDKTAKNLNEYKHDVNSHFEKTANLFNDLSKQYKNLFEHLKDSSKHLCEPDFSTNMLAYDSNKDWQQISLDPKATEDKSKSSPEHNWHPTYFEARDAKDDCQQKLNTNACDKTTEKTELNKSKENKDNKFKVVMSNTSNAKDIPEKLTTE